jgi:apolipoprotein N-acyltransferase
MKRAPINRTRSTPLEADAGGGRPPIIRDLGPAFIAGLSHALLMALAFPPINWWYASFLAPIPLLIAATGARSPRRRLWTLALMLGILPFYVYQKAWLMDVTPAGTPPLMLLLSFWPAMFVRVFSRASRSLPTWSFAMVAATLWTAIEFFRGEIFFKGYAWFYLAHPLIESPRLASIGTIGGVYLATFAMLLIVSSLVATLKAHAPRTHGSVFIAAGALWAALGSINASSQPQGAGSDPSRFARLALVQTNLAQSNKISPTYDATIDLWRDLASLTLQAAKLTPTPDVIIWPETMKPGLAIDEPSVRAERDAGIVLLPQEGSGAKPLATASFADATLELQAAAGVPLLIGEDSYENLRFARDGGGLDIGYDARFNSVFLIDRGRVVAGRYDKVRLTPFGEEMPYISMWPWLERRLIDLAARGMKLDLSAGHDLHVFEVPPREPGASAVRLATPICFEATVADLCRRMVVSEGVRRADVLVNVTNDGWFGWWRAGREQHLQIARWRCVELATPMVRAANTGISCVIDSAGRIRNASDREASIDWNTSGVLLAGVELPGGVTLYARGGWLFPRLVIAAGFAIMTLSLVRGRPGSNRPVTADATLARTGPAVSPPGA